MKKKSKAPIESKLLLKKLEERSFEWRSDTTSITGDVSAIFHTQGQEYDVPRHDFNSPSQGLDGMVALGSTLLASLLTAVLLSVVFTGEGSVLPIFLTTLSLTVVNVFVVYLAVKSSAVRQGAGKIEKATYFIAAFSTIISASYTALVLLG